MSPAEPLRRPTRAGISYREDQNVHFSDRATVIKAVMTHDTRYFQKVKQPESCSYDCPAGLNDDNVGVAQGHAGRGSTRLELRLGFGAVHNFGVRWIISVWESF